MQDLVYDQKRMQRAERLVALGTLSASWVHELKQPLTVIQLALDNILAEVRGQDCEEAVRTCATDAMYSLETLKQSLGRIRSFGRQPEHESPQRVPWIEVVDDVIELLRPATLEARMDMSHEGLLQLPPAYAIRRDLVQLFYTLLENCLQAASGPNHQVKITGTYSRGEVKICVDDDCGGIAPEHEKKVFKPFFTTRSTEANTGLGLTVVQRIVERLGGSVTLTNRFGQGVCVCLTMSVDDQGR